MKIKKKYFLHGFALKRINVTLVATKAGSFLAQNNLYKLRIRISAVMKC